MMKPKKSLETSPNTSYVKEMHVCMWLRSKFTSTCSILLPATVCRPTMNTTRAGRRRQSAPADWAKESTAKIVHRLTTGAAGDDIVQANGLSKYTCSE